MRTNTQTTRKPGGPRPGWVNLTVPLLREEMNEFEAYAEANGRAKGRQGRIVLVDRLEAWKRQQHRRLHPLPTRKAVPHE